MAPPSNISKTTIHIAKKKPIERNFRTKFASSMDKLLMVTNNNQPEKMFPNNLAEPIIEETGSADHKELNKAQRQKQNKIINTGKPDHLILRAWNRIIRTQKILPIITRGARPLGAMNPRIGAKNAIKQSKYPSIKRALNQITIYCLLLKCWVLFCYKINHET